MAVTLGPGTDSAGHDPRPARSHGLRAITVGACLPAPRRPAGRPPPAAAPARRRRGSGRRRSAPRTRRPAAKKQKSHGLFGIVAGGWNLLARGAGGLARSVARPDEAEPLAPEHRRDGVGLAVLGLAIVLGAAAWSNGIGPVGVGLAEGVRWIVGSMVMVAAGRPVLRRPAPPAPAARAPSRGAGWSIGWLCTVASVLGIAQVVGDGADPQDGRPGLGRAARLGRRHAAERRDRRDRHRRPAGAAGLLRPARHHRDAGPPDPRAAARARRPPARPRRLRRRVRRRRTTTRTEPEKRDRPPLRGRSRCRRTCSTPARSTSRAADHGRRRRRGHHDPPVHTRCGRRWSTGPIRPRTCRRSTSREQLTIQPVQGNYVLPSLTVLRPGDAAARPLEGQRRGHRGDHRRPRAVQHRRRRHRLHPRARRSPATRWSSAPRSRSRRSPRSPATWPTPSPTTTSGSWRRSRASPRSASRCRTPTARRSASATSCARRRPSRTRTRCWSASARTSRAASSSPTWRRCRTCSSPVPPVPASPAASTRC